MQAKLQAKEIIHTLQLHFDVYTDQELADKLHSTRSAISQWKVYNRIPKKILTKYAHLFADEQKSHSSKDVETIGSHLIPVVGIADAGKGIDSIDGVYRRRVIWFSRPVHSARLCHPS
jgi:hypothetical protein